MSKIIWNKNRHLTGKEVAEVISSYMASVEYKQKKEYKNYYEQDNTKLVQDVTDKQRRGKTPNNFVPTPYFATVIDTMAGYMFSNVQYEPKTETEQDKVYSVFLNDILDDNEQEIKDMQTGIYSLTFDQGIELVYTQGDEKSTEIKYASFDPMEWIIIYDNKIESDVFCGIRLVKSNDPDYEYDIDVIYKDLWQHYKIKDDLKGIASREEDRKLHFSECPVIVYKSNVIGEQSPFHAVITYIMALDTVTTGNSNEIDRLTDALLIISKVLEDDELDHMEEIKALMDMTKEDRAEYITKEMSPEFREYVSRLLINEIHKHSHVLDMYSPDQGLSGQVSGKALKIRLFDMDMYSQRIEKMYKKGVNKRIRLISEYMKIKGIAEGKVDIIYNRTVPSDFEDLLIAFKNDTVLSRKTKVIKLGENWENEKKNIEEETENMPLLKNEAPLVEETDDME